MLVLYVFLGDIFHGEEEKEKTRVIFSMWTDNDGFLDDEEALEFKQCYRLNESSDRAIAPLHEV
jgi:hypothetical protein